MRTSVLLSLLSVGTSLLGFAAQLLIAWNFGAGAQVDAYFTAYSVPLFIGGLVNAAVTYRSIPLLVSRTKDIKTQHYEGSLLLFTVIVAAFCSILGVTFSLCTLPLYANAAALREHSAIVIATLAWLATSTGLITAVASAMCQLRNMYALPAFVTWLGPIGSVLAWLCSANSLVSFALASLVGQLLGVFALGWFLHRGNALRLNSTNLGAVITDLRELPLIVLSMLVFTVYGTVDSLIAGSLSDGDVTILAYAQRLTIAVGAFVVSGIGIVALPRFTKKFNAGDIAGFSADVVSTVRAVFLCMTFMAITVGGWSKSILFILFKSGRFSMASTEELACLIPYMLIGSMLMSCTTITFRALYSMNNVTRAAYAGCIGVLCYVVMSAGGVFLGFGLYSFGWAYIMSWGLTLVLSLRPLKLLWPRDFEAALYYKLLGIVVTGLVCTAVVFILNGVFLKGVIASRAQSLLRLVFCAGILSMIYLLGLRICRVPEAKIVIDRLIGFAAFIRRGESGEFSR